MKIKNKTGEVIKEFETDLSGADLSDADLRDANLSDATFCGATIDGAMVDCTDIGGLPDACILAALTHNEWRSIKKERG